MKAFLGSVLVLLIGCVPEQGFVRVVDESKPGEVPAVEGTESGSGATIELGPCQYAYAADATSGRTLVVSSYPEFAAVGEEERTVAPGDAMEISVEITVTGCGAVEIDAFYWGVWLAPEVADAVFADESDLAAGMGAANRPEEFGWSQPIIFRTEAAELFYPWERTEELASALRIEEDETRGFRFSWFETAHLPPRTVVSVYLAMVAWTDATGWAVGPDLAAYEQTGSATFAVTDPEEGSAP